VIGPSPRTLTQWRADAAAMTDAAIKFVLDNQRILNPAWVEVVQEELSRRVFEAFEVPHGN
jgi:ribonuclease D